MSPNARWQIGSNEIYHIVSRGNNRMQVFHGEDDYCRYLRLIAEYKQEYPVLIYHYCLMPNHVHLLLKVIQADSLKKFMQGISQSYSNHYKRTHRHTGHLWQGRYKSFLIQKDSYLLECGRYIERNPLRAKMVSDPSDWPWSSYRFYAFGEPNDLVDAHGLYFDLENVQEARQTVYRNYISIERPYESLLDKQFDLVK